MAKLPKVGTRLNHTAALADHILVWQPITVLGSTTPANPLHKFSPAKVHTGLTRYSALSKKAFSFANPETENGESRPLSARFSPSWPWTAK
jgi:hypothetical protein